MTGSEVYNYILSTFKRTDKSTEVYQAITDTCRDVRLRYSFEDTKVIGISTPISALGEYKFLLPDDFGHLITDIRIIDADDSYPLKKISKQEYDDLLPNPSSTTVSKSKPTKYCIYGGYVYLYGVPDDVSYQYEVDYASEDEVEVSSITDDVAFSNRYRELLKFGILYRLYRDLGFDNESTKWLSLYETEIQKIIRKDERNTQSNKDCVKYQGI